MPLEMSCITEGDKRVLEAALANLLARKQAGHTIRAIAGSINYAALLSGAETLLEEIKMLPVCEESEAARSSDVADVAHVIQVDLKRGDDARAREWYAALQGKNYTPELEEELERVLTIGELRRLKG